MTACLLFTYPVFFNAHTSGNIQNQHVTFVFALHNAKRRCCVLRGGKDWTAAYYTECKSNRVLK